MEIKRESFEEAIIGAEKESSFSINTDSSIIFEILRNKMYSNKIGSICREISSNARDANREAGRGHVAIDIAIVAPEQAEDQFGIMVTDECIIFGDNGIGITPERMEEVFIVYGTSTKTKDNSQTGGFGLGAKTPFAYTDSFTIVTTCDYEGKRMQYTYTAILDSSQKGKMILFDSIEVDDIATGTKIIIPINGDDDRRAFEKEVLQCTQLWETRPNLKGFNKNYATVQVLESFVDQEGEQRVSIAVIKDDYDASLYGQMHVFSIDGIVYPISYAQLPQELSFLRQLSPVVIKKKGKDPIQVNACCILHFDTGELSVSANREQLQFDTRTIEMIDTVYSTFITQLADRIQQVIDEFESYSVIDRAQLLQEYKTKIQVDASFFQGKNRAILDVRVKELEVGARINVNKLHLMNYFTSTPLSFSNMESNRNELQQPHYKREKGSKSIVKLFGQPFLASFLKHVVITKEGGRSNYLRNNAIANHIADTTSKTSLSFTVIAIPKECDEKMYCQIIELITYLQSIGSDVMYYEDFDNAPTYKHLVEDESGVSKQGSPYKKKQIIQVPIAFFPKGPNCKYSNVNWDRSTGLLDLSPLIARNHFDQNTDLGAMNIVYQRIDSLSTATDYSEYTFRQFVAKFEERAQYLFQEKNTLLIFATPKTINYQLQNYKSLTQFVAEQQLSKYEMDDLERTVRQHSWMHGELVGFLPKSLSFTGQKSLIDALISTIPSKDHQYTYRQYINRQFQLCDQMGLPHTFTDLVHKIEVKYNPFAQSSYEVLPSDFDRICDQMFDKIHTGTFWRFRDAIDSIRHTSSSPITALTELGRINDLKSRFALDRINNTPVKLTAVKRHRIFQ
jgi:hypothetical protein